MKAKDLIKTVKCDYDLSNLTFCDIYEDFVEEYEDRDVSIKDWKEFQEDYIQGVIEGLMENYEMSEEEIQILFIFKFN